jgi:peptidyl-prolyl cis-trans isomerase C
MDPQTGGLAGPGRSWPARLLSEPLLAFLAIGALLFLAYQLRQSRATEPVVLPAAARAALIADFEKLAGRPATAADIHRIEQAFVVDEILFREAVSEGLHLSDSVVRARLVEEMRQRITGPLPEPTDEQLVNHYSEHLDRYRSEPAATFEHVYFAGRPAAPEALLAQLRAGAAVAGEPFGRGTAFSRYGRSMLRGLFGQPFTAALWAAPLGEWTGPLQSQFGWHYVRVSERLPPELLPFVRVRQQVENDLLVDEIERAVDQHVQGALAGREVRIER